MFDNLNPGHTGGRPGRALTTRVYPLTNYTDGISMLSEELQSPKLSLNAIKISTISVCPEDLLIVSQSFTYT